MPYTPKTKYVKMDSQAFAPSEAKKASNPKKVSKKKAEKPVVVEEVKAAE